MLADASAGRFGGDTQGGNELAIIDLVILGAEHCAPKCPSGDFLIRWNHLLIRWNHL
jgi:hypothetical protein